MSTRRGIISGRVRAGSGTSRRSTCCIVLMRRITTDEQHGQWEPIATSRRHGPPYTVVCASKVEACELVWFIGGRWFPRPDPGLTEEQYLVWLLRDHFRIQPYVPSGFDDEGVSHRSREVLYGTFVRGWVPGEQRWFGSPSTEMARVALGAAIAGK